MVATRVGSGILARVQGAARCSGYAGHRAARRWRSVLLSCLCGAFMLAAGFARAGADARFEWDAPVECPSAAMVLDTVRVLRGTSAEHLAEMSTVRAIHGRVDRVGALWQLSLELLDGRRRRTRVITAPTCDDLARAAGVAIALALDGAGPNAAEASRETRSLAELERDDPAHDELAGSGTTLSLDDGASRASEHERAMSATNPRAPSERDGVNAPASPIPSDGPVGGLAVDSAEGVAPRIGALFTMDGSALPRVTPGVEAFAGVAAGAFELAGYGVFLPARDQAQGARGGVRFSLLAGGLRTTHRLVTRAIDVTVHAAVELGALRAQGVGLIDARAFSDLWLAPGAGLDLGKHLAGGLSLVTGASVIVPLFREAYDVNGDERLHRPDSLGWRAHAGFTWELR